jgi:hypothetical protein
MDELAILRTFAAYTTILAAAMVAANMNARITVAGMADGWLENKSSLVIQNLVLLINILGLWRWLPRADKEAGVSGSRPALSKLRPDHAARARNR